MTRRLPRVSAALAVAAALAIALGGCSDDGSSDSDRLVLSPAEEGAGHTHGPGESDAAPIGDGSTAAAGGYRMADVRLTGGGDTPGEVSFRILDDAGRPVTSYVEEQTKLLHLYVVRSDLAEFRHLHPTLAGDGTWSAPVDLGTPGDYRVLAEFVPEAGDGRPVALGVTRTVPGRWQPGTVPAGADAATGDDGVVRVRVDGAGEVGADGRLSMLVDPAGGGGALSLGSYLGSYAHLTGFRADGGDGFVHVHPYGEPEQTDDGTRLTFHTTFDEAGDYRFFVQVRVDGFVHTVPVTATVA